jgi:hypothetical protein
MLNPIAAHLAILLRLREASAISPKHCRTRSPTGADMEPRKVRPPGVAVGGPLGGAVPVRWGTTLAGSTIAKA